MSDFEKVIYPEPKPKQYEHYCSECGGGLEYGRIPCPDGRPGCCVAHFGYRCVGCGTVWRKSAQQYVQSDVAICAACNGTEQSHKSRVHKFVAKPPRS